MGASACGDSARDIAVIALLLPSLVDSADPKGLQKTLCTPANKIRLLVCIHEGSADPVLNMLQDVGVEIQILIGQNIEKPQTDKFIVRAPPGMSRDDMLDFVLALSDVVLVSKGHETKPWAKYASDALGKTLITLGFPLHVGPAPIPDVTKGLDPEGRPRRAFCWGRIEQTILELLALPSSGDEQSRRSRVLRCFGGKWYPSAYFAPPEWKETCPDKALGASSALIECFERMDRSALYGSRKHRDITWISHLGAGFAVLFAVLGQVGPRDLPDHAEGAERLDWYWFFWHGWEWSAYELVALLLILLLVLLVSRSKLQERWTACRLGAEQLRIARMSLPLLVLPPALATEDRSPEGEHVNYELAALAQVKRAVRQQGLPCVDYGSTTPAAGAAWPHLIVADQLHYHESNHITLERAEKSLSAVTAIIFLGSMAVVLLVLMWFRTHDPRFLIATAAGPAFAAALHGAGMRLGIVHRSALSRDMKEQLGKIAQALAKLIKAAPSSSKAWHDVRTLTYRAAEAMGEENSSWHNLVQRYRDELP
jgi:hypothetical protein